MTTFTVLRLCVIAAAAQNTAAFTPTLSSRHVVFNPSVTQRCVTPQMTRASFVKPVASRTSSTPLFASFFHDTSEDQRLVDIQTQNHHSLRNMLISACMALGVLAVASPPANAITADLSMVGGQLSRFGDSGAVQAFSLIFVSELGDKTFFIAALLAAKFSRAISFVGSLGALVVMTGISVGLGQVTKPRTTISQSAKSQPPPFIS
mmetsp:Transcript_58771/g.80175  ORF Transcript_58771/g.80175 Transcript_58771/m.80175 type:complete len:206 (+) Transcript_58771:20-637(+)